MSNNLFWSGYGLVQFESSPLRGTGDLAQRHQSAGYDSDGAVYIYSKNSLKRTETVLIFPHQSATVLDNLRNFIQLHQGNKKTFFWNDTFNIVHYRARFASGRLDYRETSPGRYRIEVKIIEDLA